MENIKEELMEKEMDMPDEMLDAIINLAEAAALYRKEKLNTGETEEETKKKIIETVDMAIDVYGAMKENEEEKTR